VSRNILYVGEGKNHPGLFRQGLFIPTADLHWVRPDLELPVGQEQEFSFRIRYRQPLEKGTMMMHPEGAFVLFHDDQRGITSGQFAAWYQNEELIGSGVIA
jgi:tRNA-specific 2-thiouridylase